MSSGNTSVMESGMGEETCIIVQCICITELAVRMPTITYSYYIPEAHAITNSCYCKHCQSLWQREKGALEGMTVITECLAQMWCMSPLLTTQ